MRGALAFWREFFALAGGAVLYLIPPAAATGAGWLVAGETGAAVGFGAGFVGLLTCLTWDRDY